MTQAALQTIVRQDPSQTIVVVREETQTIVKEVETSSTVTSGSESIVSQSGDTLVTVTDQTTTIVQPPEYTIVQTTAVPGPEGPQGPAGPGGGGAGEVWNQPVASTVWNITHSLGYYPAVNTFDTSGDEIEGDVKHPAMNTVVITFSSAVSGVAYLS